ncbi:MAG: hypothetical protein ACMUIA_04250 [bacterium]
MKILCLRPEQRLNRVKFDRVTDSDKGHQGFLVYTCLTCGEETRFTAIDLVKGSQSRASSSRLGIFYRKSFDQNPCPKDREGGYAWDFHCSFCHQPVRIMYTVRDGPLPEYDVSITQLFEAEPSFLPERSDLLARLDRMVNLFYSLACGQHPQCYSYLWLTSLTLFSCEYESPDQLIKRFCREWERFDLYFNKGLILSGPGQNRPVSTQGQMLLWLALVLKYGEPEDDLLARAMEVVTSLRQYGFEDGPELLFAALVLVMGDYSAEAVIFRLESILQRQEGIIRPGASYPWWKLLFMTSLDGCIDRIDQIDHILEEKNIPLPERGRRLASLFLWLQGGVPERCVMRFMNVAEVFRLAASQRKSSLADPACMPGEDHPFREIALYLIHEISSSFPYEFSTVLPIALLSALPWKADNLAGESMELFSYLRSYHACIDLSTSVWISVGLLFSAWEKKNFPEVFLFWMLAGLDILAEVQVHNFNVLINDNFLRR